MPFSVVFALTGVAQGQVLWWLWRAHQLKHWPSTEPVAWTALAYAALFVPAMVYCTHGIHTLPARVRQAGVLLFGVLFAALGGYSAWCAGTTVAGAPVRLTDICVALVLGFVSLSLFCGFDFAQRRWNYANLFNFTWRNGVLILTACLMTSVMWGVLYAGAHLMTLLRVQWMVETIKEKYFFFSVTGLMVAVAFSLGQARAGLTEPIRRFWLSISAWLLPLVLLFALVWVLTAPFTGLEFLFDTKQAATLMLWFTALAINFANCAYQDGETAQPYPAWLGKATQFAWLALLPVVAIAGWALYLRMAQHGLTEQRLWAGLVVTMAAIYVLGYALSWLRPARWMHFMARTNIVAAVFLCLALVCFASPLAQMQQLAVTSHIQKTVAGKGSIEPDWQYLRWDAGRFGLQALQDLQAGVGVPAGKTWAQQASIHLAEIDRWKSRAEPVFDAAQMDKLKVYPSGRELPDGFLAYVRAKDVSAEVKNCLHATRLCDAWVGDLDGDKVYEVVLFHSSGRSPGYASPGYAFHAAPEGWRLLGRMETDAGGTSAPIDWAQLGGARAVPSQWQDVLVGDKRFRLK